MTKVLLYWNHICVLHNHEKEFLRQLAERLKREGINLSVRYFGLGYPQHLSEYLAEKDAVLPDLIVSADLELFEHENLYAKIKHNLHQTTGWVPMRACQAFKAVNRDPYLLPFVAIPLVYFTTSPHQCADRPITRVESLAFGGINNSAGKTITKAVWSYYGEDEARNILLNSDVSDMPIGAFQRVRTIQATTALVPSIYALRADNQRTFLKKPLEGSLLIPSYFCAGKSISEQLARRLANEIMSRELCDFYAANGDLIVLPDRTDKRSSQEANHYFYPRKEWYGQTSTQEFYQLYTRALPCARPLMV